jgi:transcriptional regulator with XRE-family HTH domain
MNPKHRPTSRGVVVRGSDLRVWREQRGWSQEEAASRAEISVKVIRKAEQGEPIDLSSAAALAAIYSSPDRPLTIADLIATERIELNGKDSQPDGVQVVRDWLSETWGGGNLDRIDQLTCEDLQLHCETGVVTSRQQLRQRSERLRQSFSDFQLTIGSIVENGDAIVARWQVAMTHTGEWLGLKPTSRRIEAIGVTSIRLEAGGIKGGWEFWDPQAAFRELANRARGES